MAIEIQYARIGVDGRRTPLGGTVLPVTTSATPGGSQPTTPNPDATLEISLRSDVWAKVDIATSPDPTGAVSSIVIVGPGAPQVVKGRKGLKVAAIGTGAPGEAGLLQVRREVAEAAIIQQAANNALVRAGLDLSEDDAIPGMLWAPRFGKAALYPFGINDRMELRVYSQGDVNLAPDEDARIDGYEVAYRDPTSGAVLLGIRTNGDVEARLAVTDLIVDRIDYRRALRRHGRVGVVGDVFERKQISATADRVLSTANGLTRPYIQRRDIASDTYVFDTAERIECLWGAGQSVEGAAGELVVLNDVPARPQHALMLNTGTGSRNILADPDNTSHEVDPTLITDFKPLRDVVIAADGTSETPGPGWANWLVRMDELTQSPGGVYLYRHHAIGGKTLAELSKNTVAFNNSIINLQRTVSIAALYGKEVRLRAIGPTHGEANAFLGTSRPVYGTELRKWKVDYNEALLPLLPSDNGPISLLINQVPASSIGLSGREIALAQLDQAKVGDGIVMVGPRYEALLSPGDDVHIKAVYRSMTIGEQRAKVWRLLKQGVTWKPLWPIGITRDGARIAMKLNVPVGSLRWDTDTLPPAENMGFYYGDSAGSAKIKSLAITAPDTVTFDLTAVPTGSNGMLSAALRPLSLGYGTRHGAWTNLVDSDATPSFAMPGRDLRNRCVAFEEPIV